MDKQAGIPSMFDHLKERHYPPYHIPFEMSQCNPSFPATRGERDYCMIIIIKCCYYLFFKIITAWKPFSLADSNNKFVDIRWNIVYLNSTDWSPYIFFKISWEKLIKDQGPVVRRPISANPGLNFNPGFFFFCSKAFSQIIFPIPFTASTH